ncbi:hypothetical protein X773_20780 [Mesorhizobium sp. LSJC285A00]|uniref:methyltransferase domain-containing protein n=1 Tax=Mesorhizobium sp. LSJC285A00 TaxID=1287338 RepID=UPI0003CF06E0|nr:methyltransferase domain-containing protein [Mesorhizobium sp. LSJC285A00]ESW78198.1 hypothetical protein X773_20780 [Mesorhizobium sp. LSJC285A00]
MLDNYALDRFGVIHQIDATPIAYDKQDHQTRLSAAWLGAGDHRRDTALGAGDRLWHRHLHRSPQIAGVADCAGCDITWFPLPEGVRFVDWEEALAGSWDLVAMFDVLEHIPDLSFLARLQARHLAIAVPYCRWCELGADGDAWFETWRMRLPNEHLHHFDRQSLVALLGHNGFECVTLNGFEDGIRLRPGEVDPNIPSGFFRKL